MSKTIPLYIDDELEEMMKIILQHPKFKNHFEGEASLLRQSTKQHLIDTYPEVLLKGFENERR